MYDDPPNFFYRTYFGIIQTSLETLFWNHGERCDRAENYARSQMNIMNTVPRLCTLYSIRNINKYQKYY